jgi:hypothetical protein
MARRATGVERPGPGMVPRADRARARTSPEASARPLEGALLWALVGVLAAAPAPLASNRPLPASLLAAALGLLVVLWGLGALLGRVAYRVPLGRTLPVTGPFLLVCIWVWVQAAPWTPAALHHGLWAGAGEALAPGVAAAISVSPAETRGALAHLLAYGGAFWLALQLGRSERRAGRTMVALAVIGILYAAFGLVTFLGGPAALPGRLDWVGSGGGRLSSTFVNPNGYATHAGIGMLAGMALLASAVERAVGRRGHWRGVVAELLRGDPGVTVGVLALVLCGVAMTLTQSRGAAIAAVAALLVLAVALASGRGTAHAALAAGLLLAALVLVETFGASTGQRLAHHEVGMDLRLELFEASLRAIRDRPWQGTGYGTFREAMRAYKPDAIAALDFDRAHNTYLQKAVELGLPAAALLVLAVVWVALCCAAAVTTRERPRTVPALTLAVIVLVGGHALVDFSLEMPAVAATFAFVLGLGYAGSWRAGARASDTGRGARRLNAS